MPLKHKVLRLLKSAFRLALSTVTPDSVTLQTADMIAESNIQSAEMESLINISIKNLNDWDWETRWQAAKALGKMGDQRAIDPLIGALRDPEIRMRCYAAEALGNIGDPRAVQPLLIRLLDTADHGPAIEAARALDKIGKRTNDPELCGLASKSPAALRERAVPAMIEALGDSEWLIRKKAAETLGRIRDPRAIDALIKALQDSRKVVSEAAAEALRWFGDQRARDALRKRKRR